MELMKKNLDTGSRALLLCEVGNRPYAIPVTNVREVLGYRPYTAVPFSGEGVVGVVHLRGKILPVIDLRRQLGINAYEPNSFSVYVVVEANDKTAAVLVDALDDVVSMPTVSLERPVASDGDALVDGFVQISDKSVVVISAERLLDSLNTDRDGASVGCCRNGLGGFDAD